MNKSYYAIIPANVRYDKSITPNAKLLYGEITALTNEKGYCWATNGYFAELYAVTKTSISKWISLLEKAGYIKIRYEFRKGTKEILHRYIRIIQGGIEEKLNPPIEEKLKDNNTDINNTINNTYIYDPIHKTFTLKWFKNHNKQGGYQLQPTDKDYQYAFEACKKLGNDESILDYTLEDYWENFTEAWYYKKSNRHIFSSFAVNIENHLPPGETEEEKNEREKNEEAERRKEIEKHNDKFMMGEYYKEVDNAEDGGVDFSRLKNRFN